MAEGEEPGADAFIPPRATLEELRAAAATCRGCGLYRHANHVVFGAGDQHARIVFVGEVPGDWEDREGEPFVGPTGGLLRRAMDDVGIDAETSYYTYVVKHFKPARAPHTKRRLHQAISESEIAACRPWLITELRLLAPALVVIAGEGAAHAIFGPGFDLAAHRGEVLELPERYQDAAAEATSRAIATVHPAEVLRADDRSAAYEQLVADLRAAAKVLP